ncbi:MAG: BON domain-containing protein [Terriglobia bacterium]
MKHKIAASLYLAVVAAAFIVPAQCAQQVSEKAQTRIQTEVRHQILLLPYFNVFDNITYQVEGDKVTLMGQVTQPVLKQDAGNVVKHIEGVTQVVNNIEVLPVSNMDDHLRLRLFRAIYGFPALQRYALPVIKPIRIIVKNGHVTLEGVVDSEADKNMVNIRANSVSGVFSVTNHLRVVKP